MVVLGVVVVVPAVVVWSSRAGRGRREIGPGLGLGVRRLCRSIRQRPQFLNRLSQAEWGQRGVRCRRCPRPRQSQHRRPQVGERDAQVLRDMHRGDELTLIAEARRGAVEAHVGRQHFRDAVAKRLALKLQSDRIQWRGGPCSGRSRSGCGRSRARGSSGRRGRRRSCRGRSASRSARRRGRRVRVAMRLGRGRRRGGRFGTAVRRRTMRCRFRTLRRRQDCGQRQLGCCCRVRVAMRGGCTAALSPLGVYRRDREAEQRNRTG